jgi:hypothetical protein
VPWPSTWRAPLHGLVCGLLLLSLATSAWAGPAWRHLYTKEGVRVEALDTPGRDLPQMRGIGTILANLYEILAVLDDVASHRAWVPRLSRSVALRRPSPWLLWMYVRFDFPWPASDRDSVIRVTVERTLRGDLHEVVLRSERATDPGRPPIDGIVRVPRSYAEARLRYLGPNSTAISYLVDIDPGGSLPHWLVRLLQEDLPLEILKGLKKRIRATRGQYESFLAQWDPARAAPQPAGSP